MPFISIFLGLLILLRLVIGVQIYLTAQRNNLTNLYWLSAFFFVNFVGLLFVDVEGNPLGKLPFGFFTTNVFLVIANAILIQFMHTTFYVGKPSPSRWFWLLHVVFSMIGLYGSSLNNSFSNSSIWLIGLFMSGIMVWGWHAVVSYQAYRLIESDIHVENWVKARYRLIILYALISMVGSLSNVVRIGFAIDSGVAQTVLSLTVLLANLLAILLQTITWLMPESFKRWLNRKHNARSAQRESSTEPFSALSVFGVAMIEGTGLKSMACLYALRSTVEKRSGIEDSAALRTYINTMSYNEWEAVLQHSELRRILINSGADSVTAEQAIVNAHRALVEKQSLLTFGAH